MSSGARGVEEYINSLPEDRQIAITKLRQLILENLPEGYQESINWGMLSYEVPLEVYGNTYNNKPLMYAALASQKNYMALYLTSMYMDRASLEKFTSAYEAIGKRLDMGKSCIRFKNLDDLPLGLIGEQIASTPVTNFIQIYEQSRH